MDLLRSALVLCALMAAFIETLAEVNQEDTDGCVRRCKKNMKNKNYQSCRGCNEFVMCLPKKKLVHQPCAGNTEWDDVEKNCVTAGTSTTCQTGYVAVTIGEPTHSPNLTAITNPPGEGSGSLKAGDCLTSCTGMQDGHYQSCSNCTVFAQCVQGITYDEQPCPDPLVWDDHIKECNYTSTTCPVLKDHNGVVGGTGIQEDDEEDGSTKDCKLMVDFPVNVTINGCTAVGEVKRTSCVGYCGKSTMTYQVDGSHTTKCKCCHVESSEEVEIKLDCPSGEKWHTYDVITQCGACGDCPETG